MFISTPQADGTFTQQKRTLSQEIGLDGEPTGPVTDEMGAIVETPAAFDLQAYLAELTRQTLPALEANHE
jgi:hypothetical protein